MQKQSLQNSDLDRIGKRLIESGRLPESEVEQIVASPHLYSAVKARIRTEAVSRSNRRSFVFRPAFASAFGVMLLVLGTIGFALVWRSESVVVSMREVKAPIVTPKTVPPAMDYGPIAGDVVEPTRAQSLPVTIQKASIKRTENNGFKGRRTITEIEPDLEFYPITYAGDPNETVRGGRIIRVDMPRSSLFAIGVDIPLENGSDMVKADLLVGSDGVTRAIRVVK